MNHLKNTIQQYFSALIIVMAHYKPKSAIRIVHTGFNMYREQRKTETTQSKHSKIKINKYNK